MKIRDERKEQILTAALKVFSRRGVVGTKMSMIKEEAGISHGLLYPYFKSKDELFVTLIRGGSSQAYPEQSYNLFKRVRSFEADVCSQ